MASCLNYLLIGILISGSFFWYRRNYCRSLLHLLTAQLGFWFRLDKLVLKMTLERIRAVCLHNVHSVYVMCAGLGERRGPTGGNWHQKLKKKTTKGTFWRLRVEAQTALGEMWKMCGEARSSSFGSQLTISFVWVTPLKQKSVLFHHMLESVRIWIKFHQPY